MRGQGYPRPPPLTSRSRHPMASWTVSATAEDEREDRMARLVAETEQADPAADRAADDREAVEDDLRDPPAAATRLRLVDRVGGERDDRPGDQPGGVRPDGQHQGQDGEQRRGRRRPARSRSGGCADRSPEADALDDRAGGREDRFDGRVGGRLDGDDEDRVAGVDDEDPRRPVRLRGRTSGRRCRTARSGPGPVGARSTARRVALVDLLVPGLAGGDAVGPDERLDERRAPVVGAGVAVAASGRPSRSSWRT